MADGLARYVDAKELAEELNEKIERTDDLIDEIVYELYGLTDEEIATVEETVAGRGSRLEHPRATGGSERGVFPQVFATSGARGEAERTRGVKSGMTTLLKN